MARLDVNRSGEMEVFVRVVELGGFSAAARDFRMTPSAVSKLVARLEVRLGARLLNRSTRKLQLTPEGCAYYERGLRLLADLDEVERGAAAGAEARGRIRVNASVPFGVHCLLPLLPEFLERYPAITLDVVLTDTVIDLLEERTDVAIRHGALKSSRLVARKLGECRLMIVGSPAYLDKHGTPQQPADLERHNRLGFGFARAVEAWPLVEHGVPMEIAPRGNVLMSNGEALRQLALDGLGIARLGAFLVDADIAAGRLVPVLEQFNPGDIEEIHAVFLGHGGQLPARVRALLDFLVEKVRL